MGNTTNSAKKKKFIAEYIACLGVKKLAAKNADIAPGTVSEWLKDPEFRKELEEAESEWYDVIRGSAMRRAVKSSDDLAKFFLKSMDKERYDDNVRKLKYQKDNGMPTDGTPPQITFERGEEPVRLKKDGGE